MADLLLTKPQTSFNHKNLEIPEIPKTQYSTYYLRNLLWSSLYVDDTHTHTLNISIRSVFVSII